MHVPAVAAPQLHDFLADPGQAGAVLLDVREPWELATAALALPGVQTLHLPMMQVPQALAQLEALPSIVVFCHHGVRSAQIVAFLLSRGLGRVYNLDGGIDAWSTQVDPAVPRY